LYYNQPPKKFTPVLGTLPKKIPAKYLKQTHFQTFLTPRHFRRDCQGSKSKHERTNKTTLGQAQLASLMQSHPSGMTIAGVGSQVRPGTSFLKKRLLQHPGPTSCHGHHGEERYQLSISRRKGRAP